MSLEAAALRCCVVEHGGRRYLVSPPTLATVVLTNALFPNEVAELARAIVETPETLHGDRYAFTTLLCNIIVNTEDGRAGEVLETCCSLMGGSRGDVLFDVTADLDLAIALGVAVLSLCDVPRCFKGAGWDKLGKLSADEIETPKPEGWFDPNAQALEMGVVAISERHSCLPHDVLACAFEEVLMLNEVAALPRDPEAKERAAASSKEFPLGLGMLSDLGIVYSKEP